MGIYTSELAAFTCLLQSSVRSCQTQKPQTIVQRLIKLCAVEIAGYVQDKNVKKKLLF